MIKLKLKVGPEGQITIPKSLLEKYGIKPNDYVLVELREDGILLKSISSLRQLIENLRKHREFIKSLNIKAKTGDLKGTYLEIEFEEN